MPDAKHALEITVAWLRLAADRGIAVGGRTGGPYTPELRALVERGDLVMMRPVAHGRRSDAKATRLHATESGIDRLAGLVERHGETFGAITLLPRAHRGE